MFKLISILINVYVGDRSLEYMGKFIYVFVEFVVEFVDIYKSIGFGVICRLC